MIPADAAIAATRARTLGPLPQAFGVSTDTRTVAPGDAFVALRGERYDGHDFLEVAFARGAALAIVSDPERLPAGASALIVADTAAAYLALAAIARRQTAARIVAITGSTGKTTTKALLAQLLERAAPGRVSATVANENNEIGVAKTLLGIAPDATYAVVELGARHFGEILPLAEAARPDVALLTNVGDAHLEIMGSRARLAETKWAIFATGARAVVSVADATSRERAPALAAQVVWTALESDGDLPSLRPGDALVRLSGRDSLEIRTHATDDVASGAYATDVTIPGEHNLRNAAAAAGAAFALGLSGPQIAAGLATLVLPRGRYERVELGDFAAIYDAYNASMSGTLATLQSFATEPAARRIAVLGSMAELGPEAAAMHARVGAAAARSNLAALLVGGDYAGDIAHGARTAGFAATNVVVFGTNDDAVRWLRVNALPGDLILLKGSRRYRLEEILRGLEGIHAG